MEYFVFLNYSRFFYVHIKCVQRRMCVVCLRVCVFMNNCGYIYKTCVRVVYRNSTCVKFCILCTLCELFMFVVLFPGGNEQNKLGKEKGIISLMCFFLKQKLGKRDPNMSQNHLYGMMIELEDEYLPEALYILYMYPHITSLRQYNRQGLYRRGWEILTLKLCVIWSYVIFIHNFFIFDEIGNPLINRIHRKLYYL